VPRVAALLTALVLTVSACGSGPKDKTDDPITDSKSALDAITVTGDFGTPPTVQIDAPFDIEDTTRHILQAGTGKEVTAGDTVSFHVLLMNARDEKVITNTFEGNPTSVIANNDVLPGVRKALVGTSVGSRVLVAISPEDGYGPQGGDPASGLGEDDTLVMVADILGVRRPLARAAGTPVAPKSGLPTVEVDDQGRPTITMPATEPPADLIVQPLIEGTGAVVEAGQTITVHYVGALWATGEEFDASWSRGAPTEFPIGKGGVISGWDKGLVGQKVGSQILLVVPPAEGYGAEGQASAGIGPTDTLVFVVDILDAA
jgi:peptidylprolyl isomerase